jgi:beta-lactamase regulating signal transducer with metallopeptidase domain
MKIQRRQPKEPRVNRKQNKRGSTPLIVVCVVAFVNFVADTFSLLLIVVACCKLVTRLCYSLTFRLIVVCLFVGITTTTVDKTAIKRNKNQPSDNNSNSIEDDEDSDWHNNQPATRSYQSISLSWIVVCVFVCWLFDCFNDFC